MHKKTLVILAVCMAALVAMSYFTWSQLFPQIPQRYERNIARNVDNQEEESALVAAESVNYSTITSLERFDGSSDPQAYLNPGTYLEYTYANFIDLEVINYYETRYDSLQGKGYPRQIKLNYEANVTKRSEFRVYNSPPPEGAAWYNTTIVISAPDGSVAIKDPAHMQFFYQNQSGYQMVERGYDFNFSDCYVVEMELVYSEGYAPTAAFWSDTDQIVVLDRNFSPVLVGVESQKAIA